MTDIFAAPEYLASKLASRLCHDFVGPAGGIVSALDLMAESSAEDLKTAAFEMIDAGARRLLALITFSRCAFGAGDEVFESGTLETLARGLFRDLRPKLEWSVEAPALNGPAARTLLNLVQLAADSLALGGVARATAVLRDGKCHLSVNADGPRARLHPDVLSGLNGESRCAAPGGRWVQPYFVRAMVTAAGGEVVAAMREGGVDFTAVLP